MAIGFANNNLNGHTRFLDGYISAKTRVCTTVGMMTTGYDREDLMNIVLLRPIFSPTDFIQIKGRGTRKYTFRYVDREGGQIQEHAQEKDKFKLFDFFANCEYFEEKYNTTKFFRCRRCGPTSPAPNRRLPHLHRCPATRTSIPTRSNRRSNTPSRCTG